MSHQPAHGHEKNALGLSYINTSPPPGEMALGNALYSIAQGSPSSGIFATGECSSTCAVPLSTGLTAQRIAGASFPQFAPVLMAPPPSTSGPHYYLQNPEHQYMQNGVMGASAIPLHDVQYSYPLYTGQQFVTSPSLMTCNSLTEHQPMQYMACPPSMQMQYQYTTTPFTYAPIPSQSSRPVSASSSGSPEETLMTPLLVHDTHPDLPTQYMTPMTSSSSFSTPSTMLGLLHGVEGMSCVSFPPPGSFAHDVHSSGHSPSAPSRVQPPRLARRHTGDLPFSDSPLSRSGQHSRKPYDLAYHPLRQPSSYNGSQGNHFPNPMLSLENTYMAKQRIACEGCRCESHPFVRGNCSELTVAIPGLLAKKLK